MKPKIAISIGDVNGVGPEIALQAHERIKEYCEPIYCIPSVIMQDAGLKIGLEQIDFDFLCIDFASDCPVEPGVVSAKSGELSFKSFKLATSYAKNGKADAVVTLPINKKAWEMAGVGYKGHTDALNDMFETKAIMALGCEEMFVALYTDHIPLKDVAEKIKKEPLTDFLVRLYEAGGYESVCVLGFNPHAGDDGVFGTEDDEIKEAVKAANEKIEKDIFEGPCPPDTAFTPKNREKYKVFVAMYHDQGLAPLKALYFDESINVSLGLPIVRTSVDHGTAFDIAYTLSASTKSYENAVKEAIRLSQKDKQETFL